MTDPVRQGQNYKFVAILIGFESTLSSLILAIAFGIFAQGSGVFSERVHEFPELFAPPYSPYIRRGTDIPFITVSSYLLSMVAAIYSPDTCPRVASL